MFGTCFCYDVEPFNISRFETRRARNIYQCEECGCDISTGEQYECWSGLSGGKWSHVRTCMACSRIRRDLFKCGWHAGEMWSDIHDTYCRDDECICPS